jgi:hypothetical protein
MRRNLLIGFLFSIISIGIFLVYVTINQAHDDGEIVMPLDDVYIHFQYARQLANGQPYVYNTGEGATSGATSFIYPYILAIGYLLGFQGLNLGIWAMFIGGVALLGSMWAIYRLCCAFDAPLWLAILTPVSFAMTGSVSWHAMSGMETMLIVCFMLLTLLAFVQKRLNLLVISSILLALTRPEGSLMAGTVTLIYGMRLWLDTSEALNRKYLIVLILPILAIGVQPVVNYVMTGAFSASGSQAKSLLGLIPQDWRIILSRILENFVRLWLELFTGYSPSQDIWYLMILTIPMGFMGLFLLLRQRQNRFLGLLIILWIVSISLAISTLDTAFWHFKRYQMPLMVLFIPLSIIPLVALLKSDSKTRWLAYGLSAIMLLFAVMTFGTFQNLYKINKNYVRAQPLAMAQWLTNNTPEDAVIAVHDVGMMRYIGERNTLDIVGLTTPESAQYWRNGVGSVAEFLLDHQPDYIASYGRGHGYGLYMLADTRLYANPLVEYRVDLDLRTNVALAADTQAIYHPDWESILTNTDSDDVLLDVNVANIESENRASYHWKNETLVDGFATVVYDFDLIGCDISHSQSCDVIEGARQFTGKEQFTVDLSDHELSDYVILQTKVHPLHSINLEIYVDDNLIDTQWVPQNRGHWLDIQTRIPSDVLYSNAKIQIVPILDEGEVYTPAHHQLIVDRNDSSKQPVTNIASYQDGHATLTDFEILQTKTEIEINLSWYSDGETRGDYRFFVHLYDDINQPPVTQWDNYLGNSTLPLGNWLDGIRQDTINLNIESLVDGKYQLMIGFYNVATYDRLIPISDNESITIYTDGRLVLQNVEID